MPAKAGIPYSAAWRRAPVVQSADECHRDVMPAKAGIQ